MQEGAQNILSQIRSRSVLWIPSTTNVFPLSSQNYQGGYVVVHKVRIECLNHILSTIKWVRKTPKINDKWEACDQH